MSESGGFHGSDSSEVRHEDKRRWWDDEEFCDCGAEPSQEVIDLRSQLTTALAERDEARERVKELDSRVPSMFVDALDYEELKMQMEASQRERDQLKRERDELHQTVYIDSTPFLDKTYRQGFEDFREAGFNAIETKRLSILNDPARKNGYFEARQILRALPVPERKEG